MRQVVAVIAMIVILGLDSTSQAGVFAWRLGWRHVRQPVQRQAEASQMQGVRAIASAGTAEVKPVTPATPASFEQARTTARTVSQYRSLEERRVAELGPDRAKMVYPGFGDVDPYPACKAWKWDDEDGWHWEWAEANCPWKQALTPSKFESD